MRDFRVAFDELRGESITGRQEQKLLEFYRTEFIPRLQQHLDGEPIPDQLIPASAAGRFLQYHYLAENSNPPEQKYRLIETDIEYDYSQTHARNHPKVSRLVERLGYYDFILVDATTTDVVYSYRKEIDFGATLSSGLLSLTKLSEAVDQLRRDKDRHSFKLVDFEPYRPSFGQPAAFVASPIFDGVEMTGVLVLQLPIDKINNLLTNSQNWRAAGMGNSGEALLVGDDFLLRSESRFHLENPDQLYEDLSATGMSERDLKRIQNFGTLIMNEAFHTQAIELVRLGKPGVGQMRDYRGRAALVSYGPLDVEALDWNIVAKMDIEEAYASIYRLRKRLLIVTTALGCCACLATLLACHLLLRPLKRFSIAVREITAGRMDVEIPKFGPDELGQLSVAFNKMTRTLRKNRELLNEKISQNQQLLVNTLPRPAIQSLQMQAPQTLDLYPSLSVLSVEFRGLRTLSIDGTEERGLSAYQELIAAVDELTESCGVEKIGTLAGQYLVACGLSDERIDHLHRLADYARKVLQVLQNFNLQHESKVTAWMGLDAGVVNGSLTGRTIFSYELWGPTARRARALAKIGPANEIRLTADTFELLRDAETLRDLLVVVTCDSEDAQRLKSLAA